MDLPSALMGVGFVAIVLAVLSVVWETRQRRGETASLLQSQAQLLTEIVAHAARHGAAAYGQLELVLEDRLGDITNRLEALDESEPMTEERLRALGIPDLFRIRMFDAAGNEVATNSPPMGPPMRIDGGRGGTSQGRRGPRGPGLGRWMTDLGVRDVLHGESESATLGPRPGVGGPRRHAFGMARRGRGPRGGTFIVHLDPQHLAEIQSSHSREALLNRIKGLPSILDASWNALGDEESDAAVVAREDSRTPGRFRSEWATVDSTPALVGIREIAGLAGERAEIRIALDASSMDALARSAWRQGIVRVALLALATLGAAGFLFARQNVRLLVDERDHIQDEVRRLEEQSRRREKLTAMGELAAGVAHEIRNPLNAIGMAAQRLEREFDPKEDKTDYRELLTVLRQESARVGSVIDQFLSFARPPKVQLDRDDLTRVVRESVQRLEYLAQSHGVGIELDVPEAHAATFDALQIGQSIENLVRNGIEAQPDGGLVRVTLEGIEDAARITVADRGPGIPGEALDRIFDLYYTTKPNGNGLGLPHVNQIVAEHGGRIEIANDGTSGTRAIVTLPTEPPQTGRNA